VTNDSEKGEALRVIGELQLQMKGITIKAIKGSVRGSGTREIESIRALPGGEETTRRVCVHRQEKT